MAATGNNGLMTNTRARHCFARSGLPNLLRAHRCYVGLRQADLAQRLGCSIPLISKIERAKLLPRLETAALLAHAVGRTLPEVFPSLEETVSALMTSGNRAANSGGSSHD